VVSARGADHDALKTRLSGSFHYSSILHFRAALAPHTYGTVDAKKKGSPPQMASSRLLAILTIPLMAGAALVSSAAIASADPADDAFLSQLRTAGFTWAPDHDNAMVLLGHHVCFDRVYLGYPQDRIARDIHAVEGAQGFTFADVSAIVSTAEANYCPS
jgi:Protein of unknown function (DUF732)